MGFQRDDRFLLPIGKSETGLMLALVPHEGDGWRSAVDAYLVEQHHDGTEQRVDNHKVYIPCEGLIGFIASALARGDLAGKSALEAAHYLFFERIIRDDENRGRLLKLNRYERGMGDDDPYEAWTRILAQSILGGLGLPHKIEDHLYRMMADRASSADTALTVARRLQSDADLRDACCAADVIEKLDTLLAQQGVL